jgi:RNA polymerase sigma-70 factor, ECF subfamily
MTDVELVEQLINGNHSAFRLLVEKYQNMVVNACFNVLHNGPDAEDVAQEVFIEVYESIHQFRSESKLSTWLYRISINKSLNHLRKHKMKTMLYSIEQFFVGEKKTQFDIEDISASNSPHSVDYKERTQVLHNAIASLPENQRIAFTLNKFDDLSYQEVAEVMNVSLASVESLIHRAKLGLQKKLINYYKN